MTTIKASPNTGIYIRVYIEKRKLMYKSNGIQTNRYILLKKAKPDQFKSITEQSKAKKKVKKCLN